MLDPSSSILHSPSFILHPSSFPGRLKVLYIATPSRSGAWLAEAFAADSAAEILLEEAAGQAAGMERLRDEVFDAILVSHEPGELDALDLIEGYRTGGAEEPIIVLGTPSEPEMAVLCYEVGADGYVCVDSSTTRNLIWIVARAVQQRRLVHENRRFHQAEQTRLQREQDEARRLLQEQRAAVEEFRAGPSTMGTSCPKHAVEPTVALPPELMSHYRELLRIYVIMGSGNLADELRRLASLLVAAGITARQTARMHLDVVAEMIQGLGARSSRHVMTRADLLILEVMMHLGEGYRRSYEELVHPPIQQFLPLPEFSWARDPEYRVPPTASR
jgi:DNA-binding NarL/FixJ family response regulator